MPKFDRWVFSRRNVGRKEAWHEVHLLAIHIRRGDRDPSHLVNDLKELEHVYHCSVNFGIGKPG